MMCRIIYSTRTGTSAVDGISSNGNVVGVRRLSLSAAEAVR